MSVVEDVFRRWHASRSAPTNVVWKDGYFGWVWDSFEQGERFYTLEGGVRKYGVVAKQGKPSKQWMSVDEKDEKVEKDMRMGKDYAAELAGTYYVVFFDANGEPIFNKKGKEMYTEISAKYMYKMSKDPNAVWPEMLKMHGRKYPLQPSIPGGPPPPL